MPSGWGTPAACALAHALSAQRQLHALGRSTSHLRDDGEVTGREEPGVAHRAASCTAIRIFSTSSSSSIGFRQ